MAVKAIKDGAVDFVQKPYREQQLLDAINEALRRDTLQRSTSAPVAPSAAPGAQLAPLSPREREVLDQLILGHYNKNIADHLGITQRTVEFHRANIFEKMGVDSAIELAHKLGQLKPLSGQE